MDTSLTLAQLLTLLLSTAGFGFGIYTLISNRRLAESKEEKAGRQAKEKAKDDEIQQLKTGLSAATSQTELLVKFHTEATLRADAALATFIEYAKQQSAQAVEVAKMVERDRSREKALDNIAGDLGELKTMVTDFIIHSSRAK